MENLQNITKHILLRIVIIVASIKLLIMLLLFNIEINLSSWQVGLIEISLLVLLLIPLLDKFVINKFIRQLTLTTKNLQVTNEIFSDNVIASNSDVHGKITYVSNALCKISGYTEKELLGKPHNILRHPDVDTLIFKDLWDTIQSGSPWYGKIKNKKKDGGYYWVNASIFPEFDKENNIIGYRSIRRNITEELEYIERGTILDNSLNEIYIFDAKTYKFLYINKKAEENIGYTHQNIKNMTPIDILPTISKKEFTNLITPLNNGNKDSITFSNVYQRKDKTFYYIDILLQKTSYDGNDAYIAIIIDVTEIVKSKKELTNHIQKLNKLTQNVPGTLYQYKLYSDGRACFPYISDSVCNIFEVTPQELSTSDQKLINNIHKKDIDMVRNSIKKSAETMKEWKHEYRVDLPIKGLRWIEGHAKPEKLKDGSILWSGYTKDITKRKESERLLLEQQEILQYHAHYDVLTDLPNRLLLYNRLKKAIQKAKRHTTKIAVLFIDLDHFKEINDSLGHDAGDIVLKTVTKRLKGIIRGEDTIGRLGGDEFAIILEGLQNAEDASHICNKILDELSHSLTIEGNELYVSSSIGISIFPDDGLNTKSLLKFADSAMYKAKAKGRNNFQFYDKQLTEIAHERVKMETDLRSAIKKDEFVVYYQPQVDGRTDKIIGVEALVRWIHPTKGMISPANFIPLAENTGLIIELDRVVMKKAMLQLSKWHKKGLNPGRLAINLSVKQLQTKDFIQIIHQLIHLTECKPEWLELEITESQIMTNPDNAIKKLQEISNLGISIAVDDFGTGYSSLSYLKRLPINKLKIDREFIKDLPGDQDESGITKAIISLAKTLNLRVIAEGVETQEQRDFIVQNGCNNIQGYFYSKPLPNNELEVFLENELL